MAVCRKTAGTILFAAALALPAAPARAQTKDLAALAGKPSMGSPATGFLSAGGASGGTLGEARTARASACGQTAGIACPAASGSGALTSDDCAALDGSYYDLWQFTGAAGQVVTIDMSAAFDAFLILVNPSQIAVAENDDASTTTTNARISYTLTATGTWSIAANSLAAGQLGAYTLALACTSLSGATFQYDLPVAAHVVGATGTPFISDLQMVNAGAAAAAVTLQFFAASSSGQSGPTATAVRSVAPGVQSISNDVLAGTLGVTSGLGALRILSDQPLTAAERMFNDRRGSGAGTNGFSFAARTASQYKASGTLLFLSQASAADIAAGTGFRTNIGYFNPTAVAIALTLQAYDPSGTLLGTVTVSIPALSMVQQAAFSLLSSVPASSRVQDNFYVTWTASAPLLVYAAVADNKTDDVVYLD